MKQKTQKLKIGFVLFSLLFSLSLVSAADIDVQLQSDKTSYQVGDTITVSILLNSDQISYPFDLSNVNLFIEVADKTTVDVNSIQGNNGNIYTNAVQVGSVPSTVRTALGFPADIQILAPRQIETVSNSENLLASFTIPALQASASLEFKVRAESILKKPDGQKYNFDGISTGLITITDDGQTPPPPPVPPTCSITTPSACTTQSSCTGANLYWYQTACAVECPAGSEDPNNDNVCTVIVTTPPPPPAAPFTITSTAFTDGAAIPAQYACTDNQLGTGRSPMIKVQNLPEGTEKLLILMDDQTTQQIHYWQIFSPAEENPFDIPLGESAVGKTDLSADNKILTGYVAPCPPAGATHTYQFTAYALSSTFNEEDTDANNNGIISRSEMTSQSSTILRQASLAGTYAGSSSIPVPSPGPSMQCSSDTQCSRGNCITNQCTGVLLQIRYVLENKADTGVALASERNTIQKISAIANILRQHLGGEKFNAQRVEIS